MPAEKTDKQVKAKLKAIISKYITEEGVRTLQGDLEILRPADRVAMIERLMKYVMPTLGSLKVDGANDGEPIKINVVYVEDKPATETDDGGEDMDYSESL